MNFQDRATQSACVSKEISIGKPTFKLSWVLYGAVRVQVNLNIAKYPY